MPYQLECYGVSDIGLARNNNEDVWAAVEEKQFYALADGMGGHRAGEIASSLAMQSLCESIPSQTQINIQEACLLLRSAFTNANRKVLEESLRNPEWTGMGTTLSCFLVLEEHLIYAHVGDSRLYRFRNKLELLTEDHSLRNTPPVEGKKVPRNAITRAVGTCTILHPDIGVISLSPGDVFMLCSDGLSDYVSKEEMELTLSSSMPLQEMGQRLVKASLAKGGSDNITLLLVKINS